MPFDREATKAALGILARRGVFIGTSSWKYPGWGGQLYDLARYEWRGRFAHRRFERNCLAQYAEVFKTVCVDAAYYTFPDRKHLETLAAQVPLDFQFALKVTDEITVRKFPRLDRFGDRAGKDNENFLNADLFANAFLEPCEAIRSRVGLLIFEFSRFYPTDYEHERDFLDDLGAFLERLPENWPYAVEIRNRHWLQPDYFECLSRRGVTHVFNSWDAMPPVSEQMALPGSRTNPALVAARFLLKPGRRYEEAVMAFQPYDRIKEPDPKARAAGKVLVAEGQQAGPDRKTFIYVNNRLEGNALETIAAIVEDVVISQ
jgi:uncharacterized protein YecE (DUF72 family)